MQNLISNFSSMLKEAIVLGESAHIIKNTQIENVVIAGLGGSGIGGTIISEIVSEEASVPINVYKGYSLPKYINQNTLFIASSYSGNTEETIAAFDIAQKSGAKIVCVTSGGTLLELAKKHGVDYIVIPGGMPPRACLAYSLVQLFYALSKNEIIGNSFKSQLENSIKLLDLNESSIQTEAQTVAEKLLGKLPIIYSGSGTEGVAIRFRQQLNENAKMLAWHAVIPEMNHNEIVGWIKNHPDHAVVILRNSSDHSRVQKRIEISKEIMKKHTNTIIEIVSKGTSYLEEALYHVHLEDWISIKLAELGGIDPMEIENIIYLKESMAKD